MVLSSRMAIGAVAVAAAVADVDGVVVAMVGVVVLRRTSRGRLVLVLEDLYFARRSKAERCLWRGVVVVVVAMVVSVDAGGSCACRAPDIVSVFELVLEF